MKLLNFKIVPTRFFLWETKTFGYNYPWFLISGTIWIKENGLKAWSRWAKIDNIQLEVMSFWQWEGIIKKTYLELFFPLPQCKLHSLRKIDLKLIKRVFSSYQTVQSTSVFHISQITSRHRTEPMNPRSTVAHSIKNVSIIMITTKWSLTYFGNGDSIPHWVLVPYTTQISIFFFGNKLINIHLSKRVSSSSHFRLKKYNFRFRHYTCPENPPPYSDFLNLSYIIQHYFVNCSMLDSAR